MSGDGLSTYRRTTHWFWCDDCEFGQVDPMPEGLEEYYASGEYRRETHDHRNTGVEFDGEPADWNYQEEEERAKRWLEHIDLPVIAHLDIGASTGKVLEVINAPIQVAVEPGPWHRYYTSWLSIEDVLLKCDLITCLHTLEHVTDPLKLLRRIRELAIGQVCIEVPQPVMRQWPHLLDFREKSLLKAMEMAGMPAAIVENEYHIKARAVLSHCKQEAQDGEASQ
jgi:hypothetical protein